MGKLGVFSSSVSREATTYPSGGLVRRPVDADCNVALICEIIASQGGAHGFFDTVSVYLSHRVPLLLHRRRRKPCSRPVPVSSILKTLHARVLNPDSTPMAPASVESCSTIQAALFPDSLHNPQAPAILAAGRKPLLYGQLQSALESSTAELRRLGIGLTDRVAVVLPNGPGNGDVLPGGYGRCGLRTAEPGLPRARARFLPFGPEGNGGARAGGRM